jgi:DNA helicase-4
MNGSVVFLSFLIFLIMLIFIWIFLKSLKQKNQYGVKSVTLKGETVKSIAERRIADYFERNNIRYVYEKEARSKSLFFSNKISNPDFYLPDYDVYVEYWGLVNADDSWTRKNYVRNMKRKMASYYENNIKFISLYPRNLENLDWIFRTKFKEVTGLELPN